MIWYGDEPGWEVSQGLVKWARKEDICQPNKSAVIINITNTAKKVVRPKRMLTTMLLPYNLRLLPLVGAWYGMGMGKD